ncbi:MAG TPA: DUF4143 domain-containing protein [Phycisphaerales bacterium]|nr:DUF4143 domain-containing protein [Phycisphaerales bacterium]HMP38504.1 DUF4143 domain-containing protein [Phycisphaerales bacterium]
MADYLPRLVDDILAKLLHQLPAIVITGPRASGKSTTALRHAASVVRLDRPAEAVAFRADPDAALKEFAEPVLIDEWQVVPAVMGAIKRAVDRSPKPGRFLVTGSVRSELGPQLWPATGRIVRLGMGPMTVSERRSLEVRPLVDRVAAGAPLKPATATPSLPQYLDLALASGFPAATIARTPDARRRWLESYVEQLLTHDAAAIESRRDPARLRRFFEAYALSTAGVVTDRALLEAAGVDRRTGIAYEHLLEELLVVESLPSWSTNRLKRLVQSPKRHLVDPGLLAGALGIDRSAVMREGDLLGRVLETFVMMHLRAESVVAEVRPRLHHLRTEQGRQEVDIIAEFGAGSIIAFEVKADAAPDSHAARHMAWLRDRLGKRFVAGVVLHTGPSSFTLDDRLFAAPISTLWAE